MTPLVVDDHVLLRVLLGDEPKRLRRKSDPLATTGLWYHRLCRALAGPSVVGAFSGLLGGADDLTAQRTLAAVVELPHDIALVSLRELAWPMGELVHAGAHLNLLSLEALAAARYLNADICLAEEDDNAPLRAKAEDFGVRVRVLTR